MIFSMHYLTDFTYSSVGPAGIPLSWPDRFAKVYPYYCLFTCLISLIRDEINFYYFIYFLPLSSHLTFATPTWLAFVHFNSFLSCIALCLHFCCYYYCYCSFYCCSLLLLPMLSTHLSLKTFNTLYSIYVYVCVYAYLSHVKLNVITWFHTLYLVWRLLASCLSLFC